VFVTVIYIEGDESLARGALLAAIRANTMKHMNTTNINGHLRTNHLPVVMIQRFNNSTIQRFGCCPAALGIPWFDSTPPVLLAPIGANRSNFCEQPCSAPRESEFSQTILHYKLFKYNHLEKHGKKSARQMEKFAFSTPYISRGT